MRVVHVITSLNQGGAEAMLEKLVLVSRSTDGWSHIVVSLGPLGVVGARLRDLGIDVYALNIRGPFTLIAAFAWLWRKCGHEWKDALVQTWLYHADLVGGMAARVAGRRVFWNVRQTLPPLADIKLRTRVIVKLCAYFSDWIPDAIVCCATTVESSHVLIGYSRRRCVRIDNGFDVQQMVRSDSLRRELREAWKVAPDEMLIGIVGRLDPIKDHSNFLRAIALVMPKLRQLRPVLVGRGVDTDLALENEIAALGMTQRAIRVGESKNIAAVMSALDVFVLSSRGEGFPNVLGEAMACECPAITTDVGEARRLLAMDEYVVPVADPEALARCIEAMCALSLEERRRIGARLRERIVSQFTIEKAWARYRDIYELVCSAT